ncbi:Uncharacterised protein [Candidatus Burarchaeum australiense]|nr:Uncharacterised protein [Candidatus Burarchaeum australiense]
MVELGIARPVGNRADLRVYDNHVRGAQLLHEARANSVPVAPYRLHERPRRGVVQVGLDAIQHLGELHLYVLRRQLHYPLRHLVGAHARRHAQVNGEIELVRVDVVVLAHAGRARHVHHYLVEARAHAEFPAQPLVEQQPLLDGVLHQAGRMPLLGIGPAPREHPSLVADGYAVRVARLAQNRMTRGNLPHQVLRSLRAVNLLLDHPGHDKLDGQILHERSSHHERGQWPLCIACAPAVDELSVIAHGQLAVHSVHVPYKQNLRPSALCRDRVPGLVHARVMEAQLAHARHQEFRDLLFLARGAVMLYESFEKPDSVLLPLPRAAATCATRPSTRANSGCAAAHASTSPRISLILSQVFLCTTSGG